MLTWLLSLLPRHHRKLARRHLSRLDIDLTQDPERPMGCGWFDSSHELERGLLVHEADDAALAVLPLQDWFALQGGAAAKA